MQLTHHDNRPYDEAATTARANTRAKFEARIEKGRAEGAAIIEKILSTNVNDKIVDSRAMTFEMNETGLLMKVLDETQERLHTNAFGQFCERQDVPIGYLKKLMSEGPEGKELALKNMNGVVQLRPRRVLLRSVEDEIRGYLSDHYRRLDGRPMFEAFALACQKIGALPVGGFSTDLRYSLRAVWPEVFEIEGDPILVGLEARNSDFGVGYQEVRAFFERVWCTNLAIRESVMKQVHLGGKLPSDIRFSQKTYDYDTKCSASAVSDIVTRYLNPDAVKREVAAALAAAETPVGPKEARALLAKRLSEGEAQNALGEFAANPYVEQLPAGPTLWRLSNAVSWVSQKAEPERRIELQEVAGWLLAQTKAA